MGKNTYITPKRLPAIKTPAVTVACRPKTIEKTEIHTMKQKIKVGIVGLGAIGNIHADAYAHCPDAEITALCDVEAIGIWKGKAL